MPMQPKDTKKASKHPINIHLFSEDYEILRRYAKADQRSITNYVTFILLKHLHERSKLIPADVPKPPSIKTN